MPTGYTHCVQKGEVTSFREFAIRCARAFGATIDMRDEPADAEIPERFEPHTDYHDKALQKARNDLEVYRSMSHEQCAKAAQSAHVKAVADWKEREAERNRQATRYTNMIAKVEAWEPPSSDHVELKNFMLQQLRQSLDFDCGHVWDRPVAEDPETWRATQIERCERWIKYHEKGRAEEVERTESRNRWLRQLRESLETEPALRS